MSNPDYIKVNSISDVDPNKLSLSFVGKKFIDKDNNRFSIRFNRESRKMEIVKIMIRQGGKIQEEIALRTWEVVEDFNNSAHHPTPISPSGISSEQPNQPLDGQLEIESEGKLLNENRNNSESIPSRISERNENMESKPAVPPSDSKLPSNDSSWNFKNYDMDIFEEDNPNLIDQVLGKQINHDNKDGFPSSTIGSTKSSQPNQGIEDKWKDKNERDMIDGFMKRMEEAKGRINSVLINIKSSRIFEVTGDPSENQNIIGNLTREFDIEVFQLMDATTNYLKELTSYPRAISYYAAKYERIKRNEITQAEDKQKLHLIIRWEMQESFTKILENLKALTLSLLDVLNMKSESQIKQLQYTNQLMFKDAKNATIYCSQDIEKLIRELEDWKYETLGVNNAIK